MNLSLIAVGFAYGLFLSVIGFPFTTWQFWVLVGFEAAFLFIK